MKTRIQNAVTQFLQERDLAATKLLTWVMETENGVYFRLQNRAELIRPGTPTYFVSAQGFLVVITTESPITIFDACLSNGILQLEATEPTRFGFPARSYDAAPIRAEMWRQSRELLAHHQQRVRHAALDAI